MAFAAPVSRGNFHYNGDLYVEVGALNRHKRAPIDEITTILRPDLKKAKKATTSLQKDPVGHWYEAQLLHYGLPPSKDKPRAKMRLLEALNNSNLNVPSNIVSMEAQMKKEFAAAERKAKAQFKANQTPATSNVPPAASKKRKQPERSENVNNININISLGNDFQRVSNPAKKARTTPSESAKKKSEKGASTSQSKKSVETKIERPSSQTQNAQARPKQTAKSAKLHAAWLEDPSIGPGPVHTSARPTKSYDSGEKNPPAPNAKNSGARKPNAPAAKDLATKKETKVKPEPKVKKEPSVKKESTVKKEPSVKKGPTIKKESKVKQEASGGPSREIKREPEHDSFRSPNKSSLGLMNGLYDISCPVMEENFRCPNSTFILSLDGSAVWGAYDFGAFSGIFYLPFRPWQASSAKLPFEWRGRENGEGETSFGDDCRGEIAFRGDGVIEGWISVYGRCDFRGMRRFEAGTNVRPARSMREEWEEYNEENYERERVGRWGRILPRVEIVDAKCM